MVILNSVFLPVARRLNDIEFTFVAGRDITVTLHFLGFRDLQTELATLIFSEGHRQFYTNLLCSSKYRFKNICKLFILL